eukprot:scaffold1245_cov59-Phaeocystis_antarctica.AAC.2
MSCGQAKCARPVRSSAILCASHASRSSVHGAEHDEWAFARPRRFSFMASHSRTSVCVASASTTELPSRISAAVVLTITLPTAKAGVAALRKQEDPGYLVTLIT